MRLSTIGQSNRTMKTRNKNHNGAGHVDLTMDIDTETPAKENSETVNPLIRANSNFTMSNSKKSRMYSADSSDGEEEYLSDSKEHQQNFSTPTGSS